MNQYATSESRPLAHRIASLQYRFVGILNDAYICLEKTLPLVSREKQKYSPSKKPKQKDRRYFVPAIGRAKFARRKDRELRAILDRFISNNLYEAFLITAVSQFESFLADVLTLIYREYPHKLKIIHPGVAACKDVPLDFLLGGVDLKQILELTIERHLAALLYGKPRVYIDYAGKVAQVDTSDAAFDSYVEIKATRDLIIHNSSTANEVYVEKAGANARGRVGDLLAVDKAYFENAIATLKRLSGIIKRDTTKAFPILQKSISPKPETDLHPEPDHTRIE